MMRDPEQTIGNLIDRRNTSFVGSVDEDGYPEVKAMLPPRKREGIRTFYFTSNTSSMRAAHYRAHPQACIYFVDRRFFRGVMLKGTMEVLEDAWAKELIWLDGDETYYPLLPELQLRGFRRAGRLTHQAAAMLNSSVCASISNMPPTLAFSGSPARYQRRFCSR